MTALLLLIMLAMSGCGSAGSARQADESADHAVDTENEEETAKENKEEPGDPVEEMKKKPADSAGEDMELQFIEITEIEDYFGDKSAYQVYAPKGNSIEEGFLYYYDHGLTFSASVYGRDLNRFLVESLKNSAGFTIEELTGKDSEYTDVEISDVLENGDDRYQIITAKGEDYYGTPYEVSYVYYMDIQEDGAGVLWDLELYEVSMDPETNLIIEELAECYDVDLDAVKASGEWAVADEERRNKEQAKEKGFLPETILWFNATYAPLTYSNRCDWELVGGTRPTDSNKEFRKEMLSRDWGIEDRDSAIETVENLKKNGHREKCRECMKELKKLKVLDEENERKVVQALRDSGITEKLYRYVLAYEMYQSGLDADYIAAWDLCRANYLYADFYICGYMTYEEAMDASLENSIALQQMYSSWDEMAVAYLIGYQFWQSDPMTTDDSPTKKRYRCYLDLLEMENGPYTLDWDMELQKSW